MLGDRHQRQRRLRVPRRRSDRRCGRVCRGGRPRVRDRRPGVVSRPRRVRAPVHRHRPRRAPRRGALPARRARRVRPGRRDRGRLREAARRAVPRRRRRAAARRRASWPRSSSTTRRWRSSACRARRCSRRPTRPGSKRCRRRSPTGPTAPTAGSCPRRERGSVLTDPAAIAARAVRMAVDHEVRRGRRLGRAGRGPVDLRPRRHARGGGARPGGARRARRGRRRRPAVRRADMRCVARSGRAAWLARRRRRIRPAWATALRALRRRRVSSRSSRPSGRCWSCATGPQRCRTAWRLASTTSPASAGRTAAGADGRDRRRSTTAPISMSVAAATGLDVDEVIAPPRRPACTRSAFCGFSPGFAYLTGLDPVLQLPRRATPRTRVPAGSVAIAADYTACTPSPSPGGWHLLGRPTSVLWDADRAAAGAARAGHDGAVPIGSIDE